MRSLIYNALAAAAALAAAGCATPQPMPEFTVIQPNAVVSLHNVDVRSWGRDNSILLKTNRNVWYRGVLMGGCTEAGPTGSIGFETDSGDMVDRGSVVLVSGQRCPLRSFDQIAEPPPGARR